MRAFLKCVVLAVFAMFFIACGDNPNGPDYDVQPAAKMATDAGVTAAVAFTGDTDAGELRITAGGFFHGGIIANSAMTACTKTSGTPLTISAMVGTSEKVVQRGLSPVGDGSSVWWGYIQGYPKNTTSEPRDVTFIVSATDTNGVVVGADTIVLVQSVYTSPSDQPAKVVLASYAKPAVEVEPAAKVLTANAVAGTCEKCNSSSAHTGGTGSAAGPGSIGTTTVISGSGHGGSSNHTQTSTPQSMTESPGVEYVLVSKEDKNKIEWPSWEVRVCREGIPCTASFWKVFGQHYLATDGLDEVQAIYFQEGMPADIEYPPLPPGENRLFLLMLENRYLIRDIRSIKSHETVFRFYIQHAPDPSATLTWDLSRFPKTATGEVVNTYTGSHLADIQDGKVTVYPPLDKIDFVVRHKQN